MKFTKKMKDLNAFDFGDLILFCESFLKNITILDKFIKKILNIY